MCIDSKQNLGTFPAYIHFSDFGLEIVEVSFKSDGHNTSYILMYETDMGHSTLPVCLTDSNKFQPKYGPIRFLFLSIHNFNICFLTTILSYRVKSTYSSLYFPSVSTYNLFTCTVTQITVFLPRELVKLNLSGLNKELSYHEFKY